MAAAITRKLKVEPTRRAYSFGGFSVVCKRDSIEFQAIKVTHHASPKFAVCRGVSRAQRDFAPQGAVERCAKLFLRKCAFQPRPITTQGLQVQILRSSSSMAKQFFGTDGIRGVPGTPPLDDATLYAVGRAAGLYLHKKHSAPHALIAMDTRESGPHIAAILAAGLQDSGVRVTFAGALTTPGVACLVRQNDFDAGVVISASHNPFQDNGVKLFSHQGMKFPDAVEEAIEARIPEFLGRAPQPAPAPLAVDESLHSQYLDFLRSRVLAGAAAKLPGLRIVLDCANGAAYR